MRFFLVMRAAFPFAVMVTRREHARCWAGVQLGAVAASQNTVSVSDRRGARGIARAAARWTRGIAPAKFEGTTEARCGRACTVANAARKSPPQLDGLTSSF